MNVVCFAGYSGSGKTTLLVQLIAQLRQRGLRVSVLKHAHAGFDMDRPGKDTYRHREAGASEVLVASGQRLALLREFGPEGAPDVHALLAELDAGVDWVLVEGFRDSDLPKVEVWRAALDRPPRYLHDGCVRALATDDPATLPQPCALPLLDLAQPAAVADWLLAQAGTFAYPQPSA